MTIPKVAVTDEGMPKKPLSAYLSFARDVRDGLKKKTPNASVSDIMKAVSIDWAKLEKDQRRSYFSIARKNKKKFMEMMKVWEEKHGPKRDGAKQIQALEEKRKASIVSFLTHGLEFNKAAVFDDIPKPTCAENPEEKENKEKEKEDEKVAVESEDEGTDEGDEW